MKYLQNLADRYYDVWTCDGIDAFHADVQEIAAWLKRDDLYTEADADLAALADDEIEKVASIIAEKVRAALDTENEAPEISGLYILRDLSGYGSANPVCVTREEAENLMRGWYAMDENAPAFDDVWRPADTDDLEKYWISED